MIGSSIAKLASPGTSGFRRGNLLCQQCLSTHLSSLRGSALYPRDRLSLVLENMALSFTCFLFSAPGRVEHFPAGTVRKLSERDSDWTSYISPRPILLSAEWGFVTGQLGAICLLFLRRTKRNLSRQQNKDDPNG